MTGFKCKRISKVCLLLFVRMYKLPSPQLTLVFSACTTQSTRINFCLCNPFSFFFFYPASWARYCLFAVARGLAADLSISQRLPLLNWRQEK